MRAYRLQDTAIRFISLIAAYGVAIALILALTSHADWMARQTWAVMLTGFVVVWYTWETALLRSTAVAQSEAQLRQIEVQLEQTETQIRPFVVLRPAPGRKVITLENIGVGSALNVRICDAHIEPVENDLQLVLKFPGNLPVLRPGAEGQIEVQGFVGDVEFGDFFNAALNPRYAVRRVEITIQYENIQLKTYSVTQCVEPSSLSTIRFTAA